MVTVVPLRRPVRFTALFCDDCHNDQVIVVGIPPDETQPMVPLCIFCALQRWPFHTEEKWKPGSAKPAAR